LTNLLSKETDILIETQSKLKKTNEELEQFAYAASHDMREPLRMITNYMQMVQRKLHGKIDDKINQYLHFAADGGLRMQKIIDDILTYTKINRDESAHENIDISNLLIEVNKNLEVLIKQHRAKIEYGSLPILKGNKNQLLRLFQNLIENSIKFRKKENPNIKIIAQKNNNNWLFSIRDNGIGMNKEYLDSIFLVFKRINRKSEYPGSGIGLSQCKKIVESHDGNIWVESEPEKGSTFFFTIPLKNEISN